ncbi:putative incF replication protein RepA3, partial [Escherichia coli 2-210-07_S3_C2]
MSPNLKKIIGVFTFLAPVNHIRTSSLPPYGVASHK